eukprot:scaffold3372_cov248-Prasinococcus_capsulatus_cf.AAC.3
MDVEGGVSVTPRARCYSGRSPAENAFRARPPRPVARDAALIYTGRVLYLHSTTAVEGKGDIKAEWRGQNNFSMAQPQVCQGPECSISTSGRCFRPETASDGLSSQAASRLWSPRHSLWRRTRYRRDAPYGRVTSLLARCTEEVCSTWPARLRSMPVNLPEQLYSNGHACCEHRFVPNKDERELTLLERLAPGFFGGAAGALVATPTELAQDRILAFTIPGDPSSAEVWGRTSAHSDQHMAKIRFLGSVQGNSANSGTRRRVHGILHGATALGKRATSRAISRLEQLGAYDRRGCSNWNRFVRAHAPTGYGEDEDAGRQQLAPLEQTWHRLKDSSRLDQGNLTPGAFTSPWRIGKEMFQRDGLRTLYRGVIPRGGRMAFSTPILYLFQEAQEVFARR